MASRKHPMTPAQARQRKKRVLLERVLKNYYQWKVFVEDEGLHSINLYGEEWHFVDLLEGIKTLPPRQKEALWLICIEDKREVDAARIMGFTKWSTPAQQYKNLALDKLIKYREQVAAEQTRLDREMVSA